MARYFYYIVFLNMSLNIILNAPLVLVQHRFSGAIISILLSIPIGTALTFLFVNSMSKFKNKGLPEIFSGRLPNFIQYPFLAFLGIFWMSAGSFVVISYSYLVKLHLNPEMDMRLVTGLLAAVLVYGATRQTTSILYKLEISMLISLPVVLFIIIKAVRSRFFYPEHILRILDFTWDTPDFSSIAAASFIFTGYVNAAILNRYIDAKKVMKYIWCIPLVGTLLLFTSFLVPFGFFGINAVSDIVFPWMVTVDTLRMEYGFIERTSFLLLLVYLSLTLMFGVLTWHIGLELLKVPFKNKLQSANKRVQKYAPVVFTLLIAAATVYVVQKVNQREFFSVIKLWFNVRLVCEVVLVSMVLIFSLRRKRS
ncbi:GerAB/ArcD/ProY family transporter [Peribacillus sp. SCS-155]|uniref:GerAB/ArcD/ProY family transporter n=1 Tax=Peribacillus sedimenti TaxID=3115297 RepID=UPI003906B6B9